MGEEARRGCGSWEEQIYWAHFQFTQFCQILHPGFEQNQALPDQFSKHVNAKLPGNVTLKGPSGITWDVELMTIGDTIFLSRGWEQFVHDHVLKENDILVFKYNGASRFEVQLFDGHNLCEKPSSYFVRKCRHREQDGDSQIKKSTWDSCFEVFLASDNDIDGGPWPDKLADDEIDKSPVGKMTIPRPTNKRSRKQSKERESLTNSASARSKSFRIYDEETETKPVVGCSMFSPVVLHTPPLTADRRPVLEEEKNDAWELAQAAVSSNGFAVAMKLSHVAGKFYLALPSPWVNKNLGSVEKQDVILRNNNMTWPTKFSFRKSENRGGLVGGWKSFAIDNNLQEFDACAFEPVTGENEAVVLDVYIFRVVTEASPMTIATVEQGHARSVGVCERHGKCSSNNVEQCK